MITMTPQYIQQAGGILQAISLKSAEVVRSLLQGTTIKPPEQSKLAKLDRLLVHTSPHLDEYMAVLLFRACLPPDKLHNLPLEEVTLSSSYNDHLAKAIWPSAAIFGMGGTHTGGARALLTYDEHAEAGKKRKSTSCAMLTNRWLLRGSIPIPLFQVLGEVDHIDSNGNAHPKHLGNYIKWLQETEYLFSLGASVRENIKDSISPMWKQALVEACLVAFILGLKDRKPFTDRNYWEQPAKDSLDYYAKYSLLRNDPQFSSAFNRLKSNVTNVNSFRNCHLTITQTDGTKSEKSDSHGRPIKQLLIMPYLAGLCQDYWGPLLGHLVMAHFWEARLQCQLTFAKITEVLEQTIGDGSREIPSVRTPVGELSFRHISGPHNRQELKGKQYTPWIIELVPNDVMPNSKAPLLTFLNRRNDGIGYILLRNPNANNVVLNKGNNIPYHTWESLYIRLVELEGNSDAIEFIGKELKRRKAVGCWHRTDNTQGKLADFLLNGNRAHQYVPYTSLDVDSIVELVSNLRV